MRKVNFLQTAFTNPLIIPSGILPDIKDCLRAEACGAGGITAKTLTLLPREGNPLPRIINYEYGMLNSVGLRNPGIDQGIKQLKELLKQIHIPLLVSIFATAINDFKELAEKIKQLGPDLLELNLSCPNTVDELGQPMGMGPESAAKAVQSVRQIVEKKTRIIAKLSPNVPNIGQIAKAVAEVGADAISAINTVGPGMVIDIKTRKPKLGNKQGGVSGPGIRPIAVRCVYEIYETVKVPIIGMGGVETAQDVIEMMLAGATLVGVGTAIYRHGFKVIAKIKADLENYLQANKIKSLTELVGLAHQ